MIAQCNERIMVTVSKSMLDRIDHYRSEFGLSRSAYCACLVGLGVLNMDKEYGLTDDTLSQDRSRRAHGHRGVGVDMAVIEALKRRAME